ncbi:MAG TPA: class I SAM-dependent methyltransferase [Myxococcaceae bacterium]|nr:class I SAM-dependent methyltransferase [Myxococcaceae bacterium]
MISPSWLAAPGTGEALVAGAFPFKEATGGGYVDFTVDGSVTEQARTQQRLYDSSESRYHQQLAANPSYVAEFVDRYRSGRVKNKDTLLRRALLELPLGPDSRAAEVGCNDGRFIDALCALHGCEGVGLDISPVAVERALSARPPSLRTSFHVADAAALPLANDGVDALIALDVLEHLGHDGCRRFLSEARRVLRPGGRVLVYVVSRKDRYTLHETFRNISGGRAGVDAGEGHVYENFLLPDEWRAMVSEAGLSSRSLEAYHGFWTLYFEEQFANRLPEPGFRLLRWLDLPLTRSEHGNGFLALAEKPA